MTKLEGCQNQTASIVSQQLAESKRYITRRGTYHQTSCQAEIEKNVSFFIHFYIFFGCTLAGRS
jgi:hypothetical protein